MSVLAGVTHLPRHSRASNGVNEELSQLISKELRYKAYRRRLDIRPDGLFLSSTRAWDVNEPPAVEPAVQTEASVEPTLV